MNKELLQLFDIKDDDVEFFTVDNKESSLLSITPSVRLCMAIPGR